MGVTIEIDRGHGFYNDSVDAKTKELLLLTGKTLVIKLEGREVYQIGHDKLFQGDFFLQEFDRKLYKSSGDDYGSSSDEGSSDFTDDDDVGPFASSDSDSDSDDIKPAELETPLYLFGFCEKNGTLSLKVITKYVKDKLSIINISGVHDNEKFSKVVRMKFIQWEMDDVNDRSLMKFEYKGFINNSEKAPMYWNGDYGLTKSLYGRVILILTMIKTLDHCKFIMRRKTPDDFEFALHYHGGRMWCKFLSEENFAQTKHKLNLIDDELSFNLDKVKKEVFNLPQVVNRSYEYDIHFPSATRMIAMNVTYLGQGNGVEISFVDHPKDEKPTLFTLRAMDDSFIIRKFTSYGQYLPKTNLYYVTETKQLQFKARYGIEKEQILRITHDVINKDEEHYIGLIPAFLGVNGVFLYYKVTQEKVGGPISLEVRITDHCNRK